jgi:hypothetical protein
MSKTLAKVLLCLFLQAGAFCGVPMRPDEIERVMNLNSQPAIVQIEKRDDDS